MHLYSLDFTLEPRRMTPHFTNRLANFLAYQFVFCSLLLCATSGFAGGNDNRFRVDDETLEVNEGSGTVVIAVRRDGDGTASVDYATVAGTASNSDFGPASGTLTWANGNEDDQFITIQIVDDAEVEGDEFFSVVLSNPSSGSIDDDRATITIEDNDNGGGDGGDGGDDGGGGGEEPSRIKFDERSVSVLESVGTVTVIVERSQGENGAVSVNYATADGTATSPSDFAMTAGTLNWASGDGTNRFITIPIVNDAVTEGRESFLVELTSVSGSGFLDPARRTMTVFIDEVPGGGGGDDGDGDEPGTLKFDQRTFTTVEGNARAIITVERSRGEGGSVSVEYTTVNGTAVAPNDYAQTSGILEWPPGDGGVRSFSVDIVDDNLDEGSETVQLELFNPTGGAIVDPVRGTAVLTILDNLNGGIGNDDNGGNDDGDDGPGQLKFSERGGFQTIEGSGTAVIGVERSKGGAGAVSVVFETSDSSAEAGADYQSVRQTLTWAAFDESTKFVQVPIFDDGETEGNEIVQLTLLNPTGGATLDPERSSSTLTILDDDSSTQSCVSGPGTVCLQGGRFQVEAVWRTAFGTSGRAEGRELSDSSAILWFFSEDNVEILIKTLDACGVPRFNSYWVFYAATTDVDFTLKVTDTATGLTKEYGNLLGQKADPVQDTGTFRACSN